MRIQILPLPSVMVGDDLEEPFALIFDQAEDGINKPLLHEFAHQCGAKTFVILPGTVEIVDRYAEPEPAPVVVKMMDTVIKDVPVPGEPVEIAGLPVEVRQLVHAVDRLRDDWAEADADHRHNLWGNVHAANERVWNRFEGPRAFDLEQRLQDAGERARQALGIDGTMGDAQDVPHGYNDHAGEAPYCVMCGLAQPARVHGPKPGQG